MDERVCRRDRGGEREGGREGGRQVYQDHHVEKSTSSPFPFRVMEVNRPLFSLLEQRERKRNMPLPPKLRPYRFSISILLSVLPLLLLFYINICLSPTQSRPGIFSHSFNSQPHGTRQENLFYN